MTDSRSSSGRLIPPRGTTLRPAGNAAARPSDDAIRTTEAVNTQPPTPADDLATAASPAYGAPPISDGALPLPPKQIGVESDTLTIKPGPPQSSGLLPRLSSLPRDPHWGKTDTGIDIALSHTTSDGKARMVDVGAKPETERMARAGCVVRMQPATLAAVRKNTLKKGDVLGTARIAGVMGAKRTSELIPLCHPIRLTDCDVVFELVDDGAIVVEAVAKAYDRTGVEMEALAACSTAALTIYDMVKAVDRDVEITQLRLLEKTGGKSGTYRRESDGN